MTLFCNFNVNWLKICLDFEISVALVKLKRNTVYMIVFDPCFFRPLTFANNFVV